MRRLFIILSLVISTLISSNVDSYIPQHHFSQLQPLIDSTNNISICMDIVSDSLHILNVYKFIIQENIKFPKIVLAQSLLETGYFSSRICKTNNNLFGMKKPRIRPSTAISTRYKHATYDNWYESIKDYKMWQEYSMKNDKITNYYYFLQKKGYATDKWYINKLRKTRYLIDKFLIL